MCALYVGIDLGTTNSAATLFDGETLQIVRNRQGHLLTPSVVRIDGKGNVQVGSKARRYLDSDPANTRAEFKRLMGTSHQLDFPAHGVQRSPEQLAAEVLKSLRNDILEQAGVEVDNAVISVPALFELHQTAATSEAARLAGFKRIELIQEPIASAIAAGWTQESNDGPWLVYDLGGGTFDVSLLETREGLLRVVAHGGDNFLGGRDFDRALLDIVIEKIRQQGIHIDQANPEHALILRRLRFAAEEAKIELTRASETSFSVPDVELNGKEVEIDLSIQREEYEQRITPLIERSIKICQDLLRQQGIPEDGLERLVLVGGPTVTPLLRSKVQQALHAELSAGLDPMTLVSQGAALFAGTVGLDAKKANATSANAAEIDANASKVWLQFPAMSADITPFVVGKLLDNPMGISNITLKRSDDGWQSEPSPIAADGSFVIMVNLLPRQNSTFYISGHTEKNASIPLHPNQFSIAHGLTLGEPPLARSIGIALANNQVLVYFERGTPLPVRRTFTLTTAETVSPHSEGYALKVPIVQGEFSQAHLCRLVGTLEIPSHALKQTLSVGSEVEVLLELDRAGQLHASAKIIILGQVFNQVALLVTPQISLEQAANMLNKLRSRADALILNSFRQQKRNVDSISVIHNRLNTAKNRLSAFKGGDMDAGEQVRRDITEIDASLADLEAEQAWPELCQKLEDHYAAAISCMALYGTESEHKVLEQAYQTAKQAITARRESELERQITVISRLGYAAFMRSPGAWESSFNHVASLVNQSTDIRRATELISQGRGLIAQNRAQELPSIIEQLWKLQPADREEQNLGYGSGLRYR